MSRQIVPIDASNLPDLLKIAEEVHTTKTPRLIKRKGESLALLMPAGATVNQKKEKARTSVKEALALAGAWSDLPSEHMEEELDRIRHETKPTPPIDTL